MAPKNIPKSDWTPELTPEQQRMIDEANARRVAQDQGEGPRYIGVPDGYVARVDAPQHGSVWQNPLTMPSGGPGPTTNSRYRPGATGIDPLSRAPVYEEGSELATFVGYNQDQRIQIQQQLQAAGFLPQGYTPLGQPDDATLNAWTEILAVSNRSGRSPMNLLSQAARAGAAGGGGGGGRAPLTVQLANPDTLRRTFKQAMVAMAGSKVEGFDIDGMVEAYQQVQRRAQEQAYAAGPTGGTVTPPPSPDDFIADKLEAQAGTQVQANSAAERAGQLLQMIKGGF